MIAETKVWEFSRKPKRDNPIAIHSNGEKREKTCTRDPKAYTAMEQKHHTEQLLKKSEHK